MVGEIDRFVNHLSLAKGDPKEKRWGGAVFLIGAGCSVSAGIPLASGVAERCAEFLAERYSDGEQKGLGPIAALEWLVANNKVDAALMGSGGTPDWGRLYSHFFTEHLVSPNQQRELINRLINEGEDRLNWAHACLGELVSLGYVNTVLTTNFDQLVLQGIVRTGLFPVVADGLESLNRISPRPNRPQVVHLHGSMHTYNPRNSERSVKETEQNTLLRSTLYHLLRECDLLVIVGYAGGEEGIMNLLIETKDQLESLVVYWVQYDENPENLSTRARKFMDRGQKGENKFLISGQKADAFFKEVMKELGIGAPRWIQDPVSAMLEDSRRISVSDDADEQDIALVIGQYRARVEHAHTNRLDEAGLLPRLASLRLSGEDRTVLEELRDEGGVATEDPDLLWMRAMSALELSNVESAMADFETLTRITSGSRKFLSYTRLLDALMSEFERTDERPHLDRMLEIADEALVSFPKAEFPQEWAKLQRYRGEALSNLKPVEEEMLEKAIEAYKTALDAWHDRSSAGLWEDCEESLANALVLLGNERKASALVEEAVNHYKRLVDASSFGAEPRALAGRLSNLASALMSLADMEPLAADRARADAAAQLTRAIALYKPFGNSPELSAAEQNLATLSRRDNVGAR